MLDLAIGYKCCVRPIAVALNWGRPLTVTVHQAKGPFRHLFNQWVFEDTETGCDVHFELQFEFAVPLLRRIVGYNRVVERFVAVFEARARYLRLIEARQQHIHAASTVANRTSVRPISPNSCFLWMTPPSWQSPYAKPAVFLPNRRPVRRCLIRPSSNARSSYRMCFAP